MILLRLLVSTLRRSVCSSAAVARRALRRSLCCRPLSHQRHATQAAELQPFKQSGALNSAEASPLALNLARMVVAEP
jgi:hypothetical protein